MVFTGTRADFGLLRGLLQLMHSSAEIELQLVVGGSHFAEEYGRTVNEIVDTGIPITTEIRCAPNGDTALAITAAAAHTQAAAAEAIAALTPDLAVVLGDRYEALAFATACMFARLPLAHIHGGETTEGAIDDAIRHAITQMSSLHFVAADDFRRRVIAMGAQPTAVFTFGAPGLDTVRHVIESINDPHSVLEEVAGPTTSGGPLFLVSYHPETRSVVDQGDSMRVILDALLEFEDSRLLVSAPNADWGRNAVAEEAAAAQNRVPERVRVIPSFGHRPYIAAMLCADVVVGNSSSGVIEVPFTGTPSVNVGDRQKGRPMAPSVVQTKCSRVEILGAVQTALARGRSERSTMFGDGNASQRIFDELARYISTTNTKNSNET